MADVRALCALVACLAVLLLTCATAAAQGRLVGREAAVYAGVGVGQGVGVVAEGVSPVLDVFTREASVGLVYRSGTDALSRRLVGSAGIGVGLRLLRIASIARARGIPAGDLDVGLRVGPSFSLALGAQTEAQRARAFAVFADPFVRATRRLRGVDAFAELGTHEPTLRVGVSARLGGGR